MIHISLRRSKKSDLNTKSEIGNGEIQIHSTLTAFCSEPTDPFFGDIFLAIVAGNLTSGVVTLTN